MDNSPPVINPPPLVVNPSSFLIQLWIPWCYQKVYAFSSHKILCSLLYLKIHLNFLKLKMKTQLLTLNDLWKFLFVATPLLEECEDDTHTPEMGTWESSRTPETLEFDRKGQNTSPWGNLHNIGKLLKCRCRKWPRMSHLDICSTSYGKKEGLGVKLAVWFPTTKSQESTRPRYMQVKCDTPLESSQRKLQVCFRPHPN
jgi:hypothetical protein